MPRCTSSERPGCPTPVAPLVIVNIPGQGRVVRVAGVVILSVDLNAVSVRVAQVQVESVGDAVPAGAALDSVRLADGTDVVADVQNLMLLVSGERDVVQARSVATGERNIVHCRLAIQPRGVAGALRILNILRDPKAERLVVCTSRSDVRRHDVEYEYFFFGDPVRMATALVNSYDRGPVRERIRDFLARTD